MRFDSHSPWKQMWRLTSDKDFIAWSAEVYVLIAAESLKSMRYWGFETNTVHDVKHERGMTCDWNWLRLHDSAFHAGEVGDQLWLFGSWIEPNLRKIYLHVTNISRNKSSHGNRVAWCAYSMVFIYDGLWRSAVDSVTPWTCYYHNESQQQWWRQ